MFVSLLDIEPITPRGVVRIDANCVHCDRPVAVLGKPGKGRPIDSFSKDYFCRGHALHV